jgi:5-formaminoimidazole-4-carboxamide-1-(beta)-D-ribofuranosyl 5'-monophosphate synthetase
LNREDAVLIPHGTFISEVGIDKLELQVKVGVFGNRRLLRWEADRDMKERLMRTAGLRVPTKVTTGHKGLAIAKYPGAAGGHGYFLTSGRVSSRTRRKDVYLQEYVVGVPVYLHYFYSPLAKELELMGIDRRYESNVDGIGRIPSTYQSSLKIEPSYMVVGNLPLVLRESLLEEVYKAGERFVQASKKMVAPGVIGPFCLEGVYDDEGRFTCFEFSARIVAGTNLYVEGSPYSIFHHGPGVSMGHRIARELKSAVETDQLSKVIT